MRLANVQERLRSKTRTQLWCTMPSKKQISKAKKAEKQAKCDALTRTKEDRLSEVATLREKLQGLGFPTAAPGMLEAERLFAEYIEHGCAVSGNASFREWNRVAVIVLTTRKDRQCSILLRYVGDTHGMPEAEEPAAII